MECVYTILAFVIVCWIVCILQRQFETKVTYNYKEGSNRLDCFGNLIIYGRNPSNGQMVELQTVRNGFNVTQNGRIKTYNFQYPTEGDWMQAAAKSAVEFLNAYDQVRIDYFHEIVTLDIARRKTIWVNGNWQ
jgi:hypothetical protein